MTVQTAWSQSTADDVDASWAPSASLSYGSYRARTPPRLTIDLLTPFDPRYPSVLQACDQINRLLALPERWDGGHAAAISPRSAIISLHLVAYLVDEAVPPPQVFPLPDGGVQLEWLIDGNGLEIEVTPAGVANALGVDSDELTQIDGQFGADAHALSLAKSYLRLISKPLLADR